MSKILMNDVSRYQNTVEFEKNWSAVIGGESTQIFFHGLNLDDHHSEGLHHEWRLELCLTRVYE